MLKPALLYEQILRQRMIETWYEDKYKWYHFNPWFQIDKEPETTYNCHSFVSIRNDRVVGYIAYSVNRADNRAESLGVIAFDDCITFKRDMYRAITDIFDKYALSKINFEVVVGNPAEKMYDKIPGVRVVGYMKEHRRMMDGKLYDVKLYEVINNLNKL